MQALGLTLTFGSSEPGAQAIIMTLLCAIFLYVHCTVAPMREPAAQSLQAVLLFCLGIVALSSTPFANAVEGSGATGLDSNNTPSGNLATRCGPHW